MEEDKKENHKGRIGGNIKKNDLMSINFQLFMLKLVEKHHSINLASSTQMIKTFMIQMYVSTLQMTANFQAKNHN